MVHFRLISGFGHVFGVLASDGHDGRRGPLWPDAAASTGLTYARPTLTMKKPPVTGCQASGWFWSETLTMTLTPATVKRRRHPA